MIDRTSSFRHFYQPVLLSNSWLFVSLKFEGIFLMLASSLLFVTKVQTFFRFCAAWMTAVPMKRRLSFSLLLFVVDLMSISTQSPTKCWPSQARKSRTLCVTIVRLVFDTVCFCDFSYSTFGFNLVGYRSTSTPRANQVDQEETWLFLIKENIFNKRKNKMTGWHGTAFVCLLWPGNR